METLTIAMNLSLFGIGASLQTEDGFCKIHELLPGGPAIRSGLLKQGDRIFAVAQSNGEPVDITNIPLSRAVNPLQAGVMRTARFLACWGHGEERKFGSALVEAKAPATSSVAQGGSEPS
jgi:carboxyl-terminal processing protease